MNNHDYIASNEVSRSVGVHNYRSSMIAPLPFIEFLARSSLLSAPRPSAAAESSSDDERTVTKRQVDPLHSCIEAKCSSWNSGNYLDCVYRHCVSGFQVHGKRSTDTEEAEADSFDQPEGRFLLLPVVSQSSDGEPQLFPQSVLQPSNEVVAEERREPVTRARMAHRRTPPGSRYHRRTTLIGNSRHRMRRHVAAWSGLPLRANVLPKRSYNDIADVCVEHHCGQLTPHSISYFQCVQNHCTGK